uniref:Ankyrin repeat protein n=1 Tax=Pithovirus LCPAC403 TaxID=2506596 RepID=A0A481ZCE4_9VIRU|nr:MAG: ankyrin repeat protein [Pithovirus LCPAC403]
MYYLDCNYKKEILQMDILRKELDCIDVSKLIFEFLINDGDYLPFTTEDLKLLENKIHDWDKCMKWGIFKDMDFIKFVESKISPKFIHSAYIHSMKFSGFHGNFKMLKYFEAKGRWNYNDWSAVSRSTSVSEENMIRYGIRKEDTFEIFKYVEEKLLICHFHCYSSSYMSIIMNGRIDLLSYVWKRGADKFWQIHIERSAAFNQLEILKWIESKVNPKKINWKRCRLRCCGRSIDTYKYCEMKSKCLPKWNLEIKKIAKSGSFEMFEYVVSRYEESKSNEIIDWNEHVITTVSYYFFTIDPVNIKDKFNIFTYCEERATSPDYEKCMKDALKNGLMDIVIHIESKLIDKNLERFMFTTVDGGQKDAILYIIKNNDVFDLRPYIKHVVEGKSRIDQIETVNFLESFTDQQINWKEMNPQKNLIYSTSVIRYVKSKVIQRSEIVN